MTTTSTNGSRTRVTSEPLTYSPHGKHSYFRDMYTRRYGTEPDAEMRLDAHVREMRVELPKRTERRGSAVEPEGTRYVYEERAPSLQTGTPTATTGQGGYATPPLWLIEMTATAPRPTRCVADLIGALPLPEGCSSINVPRIVTGTSTGVQTPNAAVSDTDYTDAATTSAVTNIAGQANVPLGMLEQSPLAGGHLDRILWRDLSADYDEQLEVQLISGLGGVPPTGQISGLLNVAGTGSITFTSGTPTAIGLYPSLGQAFGIISNTRKIRPEGWLLRGGRFAWLAASEDSSLRPLEVPMGSAGLISDATKPNPICGLVGLPAFTAEAIPTTLGAASNQDAIIAFRWSDALLWESPPRMSVFRENLAGDLMASIQWRCYAAAILGRYPSSIATITGTGLVPAANE